MLPMLQATTISAARPVSLAPACCPQLRAAAVQAGGRGGRRPRRAADSLQHCCLPQQQQQEEEGQQQGVPEQHQAQQQQQQQQQHHHQHQHQQPSSSGRARAWAAGMGSMGFLALPILPGAGWEDLLLNRVLVTGFWAWFAAQFGKIFTRRFKKGVWDIRAMVQPGGMPSSHSSLCAGVTTALALQEGLSSPLFAVSLAFSVIVMYDAMGVRQHAGKQAAVLNQVVTELWKTHPSAISDIKLKEVLGHTPRQVLCGAVLGLCVALCLPWGGGCT